MNKADWVKIKDFPNYEIHENEGIRSSKTQKGLKGRNWFGYPKVTLMRDGKKHEKRIHKLVGEHFIANPNNHPIVNHIDSDRSNHKKSNLEWVDNSGNQSHRWKTQKEGLKKMKYSREYGLEKVAKSKKTKSFNNIPCKGLAAKAGSEKYGVSCGREKKTGLEFVYTHRSRSKGYPGLGNIPVDRIKFIESTG